MDVAALERHCADLPGVEVRLHGEPANILVYAVGGSRFAHFKTSAPQRWRFSVKVASERFLELTGQPGVQPARWLARLHRITIVDVRTMPSDESCALVKGSCRHAAAKLPRSRRPA